MKQKILHRIFFCLLLATIVVGCSFNVQHTGTYHLIANEQWGKHDRLEFTFAPNISINTGTTLFIAHNARYPYQNLWLFIEYSTDSVLIKKDTVEIVLAKPNGQWLGKGYAGMYKLEVPLSTPLLETEKTNHIKIKHGMRENKLSGIVQLGIEIKNKTQ